MPKLCFQIDWCFQERLSLEASNKVKIAKFAREIAVKSPSADNLELAL